MTQFKSYAKGGNFATYHIDLPIQQEINEDLRAAKGFAESMRTSQQYREKWAKSYLTSLNNKFAEERQNRDDNMSFTLANHKRIFEGEQREFAGRLQQLQTEQAQRAADAAEPSLLEKLAPLLLEAGTMALGMIAETNAANLQKDIESAEILQEATDLTGNPALTNDAIAKIYRSLSPENAKKYLDGILASDVGENVGNLTGDPGGTRDLIKRAILGNSDELRFARQKLATASALQHASRTVNGQLASGQISPAAFDDLNSLHRHVGKTTLEEYTKFLGQGDIQQGQAYLGEVSDLIKTDDRRAIGKFANEAVRGSQAEFKAKYKAAWDNKVAGNVLHNIETAQSNGISVGESLMKTYTNMILPKNGGNVVASVDEMTSILVENSFVSSADLASFGKVIRENPNQPGGPQFDPATKSQINYILNEGIKAKRANEIAAIQSSNNQRTITQNNVVRQINEQAAKIYNNEGQQGVNTFVTAVSQTPEFQQLDGASQAKIQALVSSPSTAKKSQQVNSIHRVDQLPALNLPNGASYTYTKDSLRKHFDQEDTVPDEITHRVFRGAEIKLNNPAWLGNNTHLSGYSLLKQAVTESIDEALESGDLKASNYDPKKPGFKNNPAKPIELSLGPKEPPGNIVEYNKITERGIKEFGLEYFSKPDEFVYRRGTERAEKGNLVIGHRKLAELKELNGDGYSISRADVVDTGLLHSVEMREKVRAAEAALGRKVDATEILQQELIREFGGNAVDIETAVYTPEERAFIRSQGAQYGRLINEFPQLQPRQPITNQDWFPMSATSAGGSSPDPQGVGAYNTGGTGNYGPYTPFKYPGRLNLTRADAEAMAVTIAGEAGTLPGKGFAGDDAMVAGVIINRMADPRYPGTTAYEIVSRPGQFVGWHPGETADPRIVNWLLSQEGQSVIIDALHKLEGRTSFKGLAEIHNKGEDDPQAHPRANYAHFKEQRGRNDPTLESYKRDDWKKLWMRMADLRGGGGFI